VLLSLPEIQALDTRRQLVRIPHETDVPLTDRVRQLIDAPEFRRLGRISQLGLVSLVYPAANHTRLEHSLGVYRTVLVYLKQLAGDARFSAAFQPADAEALIVAALLHDLGHWPFCHAIEDMALPGVPTHELFANSFLLEGELADALRDDWNLAPRDVTALLSEKPRDTRQRIAKSVLSGPIDIDKMDYLVRDSLHAGVPYGRNFDQQRLVGSLCLNQMGDGLAITDKGRTAAEMMVFARYVMFSEVYWHHAVRSATAMLQRAFFLLHRQLDLDQLFRLGELSHFQSRELYERLARRPYTWLAQAGDVLAAVASTHLGRRIAPHEILIDAPPVRREVEFHVEVYFPKESVYRPLAEVSPAVVALATRQFDDYVKRVRVFAHPRLAADLRALPLDRLLGETLRQI
jgi:HD superfamily phosphohydrolase